MGAGQGLAKASKLLIELILKGAFLTGLHRALPCGQEHEEQLLPSHFSTIQ